MSTHTVHRTPSAPVISIDSDRVLWAMAVLYYGVGDLVTTVVGLQFENVAEVGLVAAPLVEQYGIPSLFWLKLAVLAGLYAFWYALPRPYCTAVPAALVFTGILVSAWNVAIITITVV